MASESSKSMAVAAGLALLASVESLPEFTDTTRHAPVRGRVVGRDAGKGLQRQPRNQPCQCGSGKKAKRCCVFEQSQNRGGGSR